MKKIFGLAVLLVLLFPGVSLATETEANGQEKTDETASFSTSELAENLDMSAFQTELDQLDQLLENEHAPISMQEIWAGIISGDRAFDLAEIWDALGAMVFSNIRASSALLGQLILLALMAVLLTLLKDSFAGGQTAQLGRWVVYLLLIGIALAAFIPSMEKAAETVEGIRDLLYALLPLLIPLLAAVGGLTTISLVHPALLSAISILMSLMSNLIFPLICFSAILRICGSLAPRLSLEKMATLFKDIALGLMSICITVFIAFLGITGMAAASWDGLAVKAIKSASGAFIPIVGHSLADAMDSVLGTALVLKNALGLIGTIAILFICALPALQILLQALVFRIAGALVQPLGEEKLAEAVTGLGNSMLLLFAALAVCGLFAYFALALIVGLGNMTMMMR